MASQSVDSVQDSQRLSRYKTSWKSVNTLLNQGNSWSGHERNCAYLNPGGNRQMVNMSAVAGLDFDDDGRGLAVTDWDGDGDLDLWLTNRTAPSVRLLRNETPAQHHWVAFRLEGRQCHRDAIGARVELFLENESVPRLQTVRAGDSFISQSTKWVHFGVGPAKALAKVVVRWPGGDAEVFEGAVVNRHCVLVQGEGRARPLSPRENLEWTPRADPKPQPSDSRAARVISYSRPPLPQLDVTAFDGTSLSLGGASDRAVWVSLWGSWCLPCLAELNEVSAQQDRLEKAGIRVVALSVDLLEEDAEKGGETKARRLAERSGWPFVTGWATSETVDMFEAVQRTLLQEQRPLPLPSSFLLDRQGRVAVVYRGAASVEHLVLDAVVASLPRDSWLEAASPFPGARSATPARIDPIQVALKLFEGGFREHVDRYMRQLIEMAETKKPGYEDTDRAGLHYFMGTLLEDGGKQASAMQAYRYVLSIEPKHPEAHRNLAGLYRGAGQWRQAVDHFEAALAADPRDVEIRLDLARTHYQSNQMQLAVRALADLLRIDSNHLEGAKLLAWILATATDPVVRDGKKAVSWATHLVRLAGSADPVALDVLSAAHAESGDFESALRAVGEATRLAREAGYPADRLALMEARSRAYEEKKPWREGFSRSP